MKKFAKISLAAVMTMGLFACTDYVDKYESDYKEAYGDEEVFKANLDKATWEWASTCETGDWLWCAVRDGEFMSQTVIGTHWVQFAEGSVRLIFAGKNDMAYNYTTDLLPEDLTTIIRRNGGVAISLENASGKFEAGIGVSIDGIKVDENSAVVLAYGNEYPGAKLCLRDVDAVGNVESEWCWALEKGEVTTQTFAYKNLEYVKGEKDLEKFIDDVNYLAVVLTKDASVSKGLTIVAVGFSGDAFGIDAGESSSGENGSSTHLSSSSTVKPSSSSAQSSSSAKSGSSGLVELSGTALGSCYPSPSNISVGEGVYWKFEKGSKLNLATRDLALASFSWTFIDGTPSSEERNGGATSSRVSYATAGTKTAKLTFEGGGFKGSITCSTLAVQENAVVSSSSAEQGFLWTGLDKSDEVKTGFGSGGTWTTLNTDGTVVYRPSENPYDTCQGRCGFIVGKGDWLVWDYFELDSMNTNTYDVNVWGGICVTYTSNGAVNLALSTNSGDHFTDYGVLPRVQLPRSSGITVRDFSWSDFRGGLYSTESVSGYDYAAMLHSIIFEFNGDSTKHWFYNIYEVGSFGSCTANGLSQNVDASYFENRIPSSSSFTSSSSVVESSSSVDAIRISTDSIVGFAQIGPFSEASTVSLYELYDGRTLSTTGKKFTTYTTNNGGRYKFPERTLESQYVMLTAEGKYRNLVTGEETGSEITLTSLSDIRKRSSVNINMLTYLEYERVYHLVTVGDQMGQKLTVKNAKRQALREILEQFHIELTDNTDAEDMDIFGSEDADAALIAVTILLQGDRSVSQLVALLTQITIDLADDGEWADSAKKVEIAKWAATQDLTQIRARLESWGGGSVPDFEKYIDNFVWQYMPAWQFLNPEKNYGVFVDDRDGQIYKTIKIGEQTWMAQNLNYAPKSDTVSRCYDDDPDSCAVYGRLYDSAAAVKVCPAGWHLPLKSDFESLVAATKVDTSVAGTKLKASERWIPSSAGTDDLGFSALPGGIWHAEFIWGGEETHFWALENSGSTSATYAMFLNSYTYAKIIKYSGDYMFSVRCVED